MRSCYQFQDQNIYQHGLSVKQYLFDLLYHLRDGKSLKYSWKLPPWIYEHKERLFKNLPSDKILKHYTIWHDCGKFKCRILDENGKQHFPNHAEMSYQVWKDCGGSEEIGKLILKDMDIHKLKCEDITEFVKQKEAGALLLSGFAEIHSNAQMFGGLDSTGFKIKWKHLNSRGKIICQIL